MSLRRPCALRCRARWIPACAGWPRRSSRTLTLTLSQRARGVARPLKQLHSVAFRCIPIVYAGWGFTLILAFSPQGRRDLTACAGTTVRSGQEWRTLNSVAFGCNSRTLTLTLSQRARGPARLRGKGGVIRVSDACNQCRGWRRDGAMGSCRRSAPCALRCRARWIPASAGMTGACAGTTGAPLRPVCAPLSRTLDSSLRWNDGACAGDDGACAGDGGGAPPPRVRSAVAHAGFQPSLE